MEIVIYTILLLLILFIIASVLYFFHFDKIFKSFKASIDTFNNKFNLNYMNNSTQNQNNETKLDEKSSLKVENDTNQSELIGEKNIVDSKSDLDKTNIQNHSQFKLSQARVQGHSHKKMTPQVPCQDYGKAGVLINGYNVIIVSDGAGSSRLSHIASEFCVNTLYSNLQLLDFSDIKPNKEKPELLLSIWNQTVKDLFGKTRNALLNLSKENAIETTDLYCTLILVIQTEWGFLSANIGDGRSGVSNGKPHPLTVPFQTFTAGATFFLIKDGWEKVFRTNASQVSDWNKIKYFFATTDGCQDFLIDWNEKALRSGIYDDVLGDEARYDSNVPYEPFFDGLLESLNEVNSEQERNDRLKQLIEKGIYIHKGEEKELKSVSDPMLDDDKTLIIFHK